MSENIDELHVECSLICSSPTVKPPGSRNPFDAARHSSRQPKRHGHAQPSIHTTTSVSQPIRHGTPNTPSSPSLPTQRDASRRAQPLGPDPHRSAGTAGTPIREATMQRAGGPPLTRAAVCCLLRRSIAGKQAPRAGRYGRGVCRWSGRVWFMRLDRRLLPRVASWMAVQIAGSGDGRGEDEAGWRWAHDRPWLQGRWPYHHANIPCRRHRRALPLSGPPGPPSSPPPAAARGNPGGGGTGGGGQPGACTARRRRSGRPATRRSGTGAAAVRSEKGKSGPFQAVRPAARVSNLETGGRAANNGSCSFVRVWPCVYLRVGAVSTPEPRHRRTPAHDSISHGGIALQQASCTPYVTVGTTPRGVPSRRHLHRPPLKTASTGVIASTPSPSVAHAARSLLDWRRPGPPRDTWQ